MAEKYTKVFTQKEQFYCPGAPVIMEASALLKDNQTGRIIGQVKFKNISTKVIRALTVKITATDVTGAEVEGIERFQYLDLNVQRDVSFGSQMPIIMPDTGSRAFVCRCVSALFGDGTSWECPEDGVWYALPQPMDMEVRFDDELIDQFERDTDTEAKNLVTEHWDLWYCCCGAVNDQAEKTCHKCKKSKEFLLAAQDLERLTENKKRHDALQQQREDTMVAQTKKTLKLAAIIVAVLLVLTVAVGITAGGIAIYNNLPSTKYSRAVALMEEKDYREAELIFHEIEGYKNAAELEIECRWREALEVYLDGNYQRANTMFAKLSQGGLFEPGYVSETIDNYWLEMAAEHISHWELEEALEVGEKSDRERVRQQIRSMLYEKALYCIENDILSRATEIRDLLGDYKDLPQRVEQARQEASYERAVELFNEGEYEDALDYFLDLGDFKDSLSYIESNYKQVRTEEKVTSYTFDEKKEKQKHLSSVTYKLTYNSDGQLTRKESDGLIYEYFYENGLLKQENLTFKNGNAWFKYRYEYEFDDADRMVKKSQICYEEQGGSATDLHWTYVYDREGRLITETKLREQSNVDNYCYHYTYDREGRIKQVVVDYLDMEGKPVTEAMYTIDYTYDDQGRLIKVYNNEGYYNTLFYELDTKEYTYDDRGNLVKEDWYHGNWKAKTVYQSYCYEYTYQWVYDGEQT